MAAISPRAMWMRMLRITRAEIVVLILLSACTTGRSTGEEIPKALEKCSTPAVEITNNDRQQVDVVAIVANGETTGRPVTLGIIGVGQKERFPIPRFTAEVMLRYTATGRWVGEGSTMRKYVCDDDRPAK